MILLFLMNVLLIGCPPWVFQEAHCGKEMAPSLEHEDLNHGEPRMLRLP